MSVLGVGWVLQGLSAGAVGALAAGGAAALTALYLLKPRRRRVLVPFAPLWLGAAGERRAERLARRLRRWLSLALQLSVFALLLLAAADPQPAAAEHAGRSVVVLIDRSASMSAQDEPGTRLGAARARARALVTGLGRGDRALVASFAAEVAADSGFEADADRLVRAIDGVGPSQEPGDLGRALSFAAAVLRGRPHPTIVLISDGAFSEEDRQPARAAGGVQADASLDGVDVRWAAVGRRARNVGILSFAARRLPADPTSIEAALTVRNFGPTAVDVGVELTAGRVSVERLRLTLAPGEARRHVLPDVAAPDARLEARLVEADDLPLDDRAFAVVPGLPHLRVLRVGPANLYLEGALLSLGRTVNARHVPAEAVEASRPGWGAFDAVIFDGVAPTPAPTSGRFLYLDPHGPGSPFVERGVLREPVLTDVRRAHPLLRQLELADVNVAEARRLTLGAGDVAVASSMGVPLIVARQRPGLRLAALAFDPRRSDLPMRAAFPLLLGNALGWLADTDAQESAPAMTGGTARLTVARGAASVDVEDPAGAHARWPAAGDVVELPIARVGFYRVGGATIAANLADATESNTAPAAELVVGGRALLPPDPPARHGHRPLAQWALLAAAALLLLEWGSTHRRWTV